MQDFCVISPDEGRTISLPLATIVVKTADADVAGGKIVGELTAEPGFSGPGKHSHSSQAELFYVLDGEFSFQVEDQEIQLYPGMSIIIRPNTVHNFANISSARARLLVIGAPEEIELYLSPN
jgi:uncharacterized cupin superfamily protein